MMDGAILVLNCGSSSLKYRLFDVATDALLAEGIIERIGEAAPCHHHTRYNVGGVSSRLSRGVVAPSHREAFNHMREALDAGTHHRLLAIGHRVVHGGEDFHGAVPIDAEVEARIEALAVLAPLHNPANLVGIRLARQTWPEVPQVAAFDTAFHHTLPERAFRYAVPDAWYGQHQVRRYGFHGLSHEYVAQRAAAYLGKPLGELNLITLHLGNGASACAIQGGRSVDTSMGFTPLEGLVMGTRSGDLDPAVPLHMERVSGLGWAGLDHALNHECGLKGLAGVNDMREILARAADGDAAARLALEVYTYRIRKYIGAYLAVLGRVDALVFTAGVGENAPRVRSLACAGLEGLGIALDEAANTAPLGEVAEIQQAGQPVRVLVIRTNEELHIARQVGLWVTGKG
ncbi:MAG: acetate kinase [Burkholderiales bacterium]|nr:acetate kinase [Burkholderiales bacterium]